MVRDNAVGEHVFTIYLPHASCVELLGSFNHWKPQHAVSLTRDDRGWWSAAVPLEPGEHEFCYLVDGGSWLADYAAGGVRRNPDGRWISLLCVDLEPVELVAVKAREPEVLPGRDAEAKPTRRAAARSRASDTPSPKPRRAPARY